MILMRENSFRGLLEGVGLKIETFLGPEWQRAKRVPFGPKDEAGRSEFTKLLCPVPLPPPTHKALRTEQVRNQQQNECLR
jgi:hypothetical protein